MGLVAFNMVNPYSFLKQSSRPKAEYHQSRITIKSKAEIVAELNQTISAIHKMEQNFGGAGPQGYKVYAPAETGQLIKKYQDLLKFDHYLNTGNWKIDIHQWEGYSFIPYNNKPYEPAQVRRALDALLVNKVPDSFVDHLKIFILPYAIPGVSGLGANGYILLSARDVHEDLIENQLPVTLYHEIGHHVNFTYMPKDSIQGETLWKKFLQIRGGTWHGPGAVNTKSWAESSEETFAEDFRMLFGKDQPYFGDLTLGDPRVKPEKAVKEKRFIINLATQKADRNYQSPWIPGGRLWFWRIQDWLVICGWMLMSLAIIGYRFAYSIKQENIVLETNSFINKKL
jgi:hypothetical protein